MIKTCRIYFGCLIVLLLLWQIPSIYNFFAVKPKDTPFTLYSSVVGKFAMLQHSEDKKKTYKDHAGVEYTEKQFDSILPTFYYRQLITDDRFPDSICGRAVTPRDIQTSNFNMRISPLDLNAPQIGVQQLLESMSGRVDLELPDDVFRITDSGMEFVKMATNEVDNEKSSRFTEMLRNKGFAFPAYRISGNPTDRKEYDEGYVMLDANRKLFHIKQTIGRPYVRAIDIPKELIAEHVFITEFPSRKWLCFISDAEGGFWVVERDSYAVRRTEIPKFNPDKESMLIIGNMFDWTVRINRSTEECYYAISANDYTLIDSLSYSTPNNAMPGLKFTTTKDKFVKPRFSK